MRVTALRTPRFVPGGPSVESVLDEVVRDLPERSIVAITSKIVSIAEGRVVDAASVDKQAIIEAEADAYLPREESRYGVPLTIKDHLLIPYAGIDESNSGGTLVLWPQDAPASANRIRRHLMQRHGLSECGVVITDSKTTPLRWGTTGIAIAFSGFEPLYDYRGQKDLFGRELHMTQVNVADGLAATAVLAMGEGAEQTPLAIINGCGHVTFCERDPTPADLASMRIPLENDLYAPLLTRAPWRWRSPGEEPSTEA